MPEPDTPTAVPLDPIEHFVETWLLCQALQLDREVLLKRLAALLSPPLKRSVDIGWEITNEHVCHACIMLSYRVPGQAASRVRASRRAGSRRAGSSLRLPALPCAGVAVTEQPGQASDPVFRLPSAQ